MRLKKSIHHLSLCFFFAIVFNNHSYGQSSSEDESAQNIFISLSLDGKNGLSNGIGEIIVPTEYSYLWKVDDEFIWARKDGKSGYLGLDNSIIIPLVYEGMSVPQEGFIRLKKDGFWGIVNYSGETICPFEYPDLCNFTNGKALFIKNDKQGELDTNGVVLWSKPTDQKFLDCEEDVIMMIEDEPNIQFGHDCARGWCHMKYCLVNYKYKIEKEGALFGLRNKSGDWIIPPNYSDLIYYENGIVLVKKDEMWGAFNENGEIILPLIYDHLSISL